MLLDAEDHHWGLPLPVCQSLREIVHTVPPKARLQELVQPPLSLFRSAVSACFPSEWGLCPLCWLLGLYMIGLRNNYIAVLGICG